MSARSSIRTSSLAVLALAALLAAPAAGGPRRSVHGLPLPPRTRALDTPDLFASGRGFRKTVEYYQRYLKKRGIAHDAIPIYRYRGTVVARFLATDRTADWAALHVFKADGRTHIVIVPRDPLDEPPPKR